MGYRPEFDIRLAEGEVREKRLREILTSKTIEVKADLMCRKTGNVLIEYCQGQSTISGIAVTSADFWAIEFQDDVFLLIPTDALRKIARNFYRAPEYRVDCGDNNNKGVKIPIVGLVDALRRM